MTHHKVVCIKCSIDSKPLAAYLACRLFYISSSSNGLKGKWVTSMTTISNVEAQKILLHFIRQMFDLYVGSQDY